MSPTRGLLAVVAVWSVVVVTLTVPAVEASCSVAGFCCPGKNVTCRVPDKNGHKTTSHKTCFCDEHCIHVGDCCEDYKRHCKAVDCRLGDWHGWGKCSKECGWGSKERRRPILVHPSNGGQKCGTRVEKTFCYGVKCKTARHSSDTLELREIAKVIPATYGRWRQNKLYDPYRDIRRNLFHHYSANQIIHRPGYCAKFEVTRVRDSCQTSTKPWSRNLRKGETVCVECQQLAMKRKLGVRCKGHGVYLKETRWNAVTVPGCHGKWVMRTQHEECSCNPTDTAAFILI